MDSARKYNTYRYSKKGQVLLPLIYLADQTMFGDIYLYAFRNGTCVPSKMLLDDGRLIDDLPPHLAHLNAR
jgi:hypothetical protein